MLSFWMTEIVIIKRKYNHNIHGVHLESSHSRILQKKKEKIHSHKLGFQLIKQTIMETINHTQ